MKAAATLSNPRIVNDSSMEAGQKVTWDCIWFGSYPQTEIVDQASTSGTYGKGWEDESDYEVNVSLYNTLQNASSWDSHGDVSIGGKKYRRIKAGDSTYVTSGSSVHYDWNDTTSYHYFRYEPIKWRILNVSEGKILLLADKTLDDQKYNTQYKNVTWETSTIRSWMNGYESLENIQEIDYSTKNFIESAFTSEEQSAIYTSNVVNEKISITVRKMEIQLTIRYFFFLKRKCIIPKKQNLMDL